MPVLIRRLTAQGLEAVDYQADSLQEAVRYEPDDGVYTVTNTYNKFQVLKFDAHLDRLEDSARRENIPLKIDRPLLRQALRQLIDEPGYGDARFRVSVSRQRPDELILTLEPFNPPPAELIENGARCVTVANCARLHPEAKTTDWMRARAGLARSIPEGIYEAFLLDVDGYILEGLSSNFYAILGDELWTAGEGVLPGIAQQVVFEIAPEIIRVNKRAAHISDLLMLQECFLTSSSRGIIPVVEIDGLAIGKGMPGSYTKALRRAYHQWLQAHLEDL